MTTKQQIVELLKMNSKAVCRALVVLNERQTLSEQSSESTINHNGVGFTPADARMGTSMAQFYTNRGFLTEKQLAYWLRPNVKGVPRICKYAGQLVDIAEAKKIAQERVIEKTAFASKEAKHETLSMEIGELVEDIQILEHKLKIETYEYGLYVDSDDEPTLTKMNLSIVKLKEEISQLKKQIASKITQLQK